MTAVTGDLLRWHGLRRLLRCPPTRLEYADAKRGSLATAPSACGRCAATGLGRQDARRDNSHGGRSYAISQQRFEGGDTHPPMLGSSHGGSHGTAPRNRDPGRPYDGHLARVTPRHKGAPHHAGRADTGAVLSVADRVRSAEDVMMSGVAGAGIPAVFAMTALPLGLLVAGGSLIGVAMILACGARFESIGIMVVGFAVFIPGSVIGYQEYRAGLDEDEAAQCAATGRLDGDVVIAAADNPDVGVLAVPWETEPLSYNELRDAGCGRGARDREDKAAYCAATARLDVEPVITAALQPRLRSLTVPWDIEPWSYNELRASGCGSDALQRSAILCTERKPPDNDNPRAGTDHRSRCEVDRMRHGR